MMEWQSMDTVPKDGSWFLAAWDGETRLAKWLDNSEAEFGAWEGFVVPSMMVRPRSAEPELWMPMPPFPNENTLVWNKEVGTYTPKKLLNVKKGSGDDD